MSDDVGDVVGDDDVITMQGSEVKRLAASVDSAAKNFHSKVKWLRRAAWIGAISGLLSLIIVPVSVITAHNANNAAHKAQGAADVANDALERQQAETSTRRIAYCKSLPEIGQAIKGGDSGLADTVEQVLAPTASDKAGLQAFVDALKANSSQGVDVAIAKVRKDQGFDPVTCDIL